MNAAHDQPKTKVFMSYSRQETVLVEALHTRLTELGYEVFRDREDIVPGEPWKARLDGLILAADAVLFVMTDDSLSSEFCIWEIERTISLGKRLIPLVHGPRTQAVPQTLAALNYVFTDDPGNGLTAPQSVSLSAVIKLRQALDTDVAWVREHSRLTARAGEWKRSVKRLRKAKLLRRGDVDAARAWMGLRPGPSSPVISDEVISFVEASEAHERAERERLLTITGRAFVKPARQALADGRIDASLRIAAAAVVLSEDAAMTRVPEMKPILYDAVRRVRTLHHFSGISPEVLCVQFSPDNQILAFGDAFGMVTLFALADGERKHALNPHQGWVTAMTFSVDGNFIATGGADDSAAIIDVAEGRIVARLTGHEAVVNGVAFSLDGKQILTSSLDQTIRLWDVSTAQQLDLLMRIENYETANVKYVNGRPSIEVHSSNAVRIWEAKKGWVSTVTKRQDEMGGGRHGRRHPLSRAVTNTGLIVSQDNVRVCVIPHSSSNCTPRIVRHGESDIMLHGHKDQIESAAFSNDGRRVITMSADKTAIVWDSETGKQLVRFADFEDVPLLTSFSHDGRYVATHSLDGLVSVWDPVPDNQIGSTWGHDQLVSSVRFSPSGTHVVTTSMDGTARIWNSEALTQETEIKLPEGLWHACFSRDGSKILLSGSNALVAVFDSTGAQQLCNFVGHSGQVDCAEFSADGLRIVTASADQTARIWDARTGEMLQLLAGHKEWVRTAYFSPDDARIITAGGDCLAIIWDASSGRELLKLKGHRDVVRSAVFSPDGSLVLTSSDDRTARIWNSATGKQIRVLEGHKSELNSAVFDERQEYVATAACDNARIWHLETGRELMSFPAPGVDARDVAFSPDGTRLAVALGWLHGGSAKSLAELWDISRIAGFLGDEVKALAACCLRAGTGYRTPAEREDLLMQSAPDNLLAGITRSMSASEKKDLIRRGAILASPLHPACYSTGKRRLGYVNEP